ncbi:MAG: Lrp/AsnC family transcriptional regulator [Solobacterium sp.]|nr:Lrp/AsnC family transcriptional regulator [Solobacterium sp.]MBR3203517.1 Lrp/AsnC family transcriptional regulator [Solobacterium sp.]MBR3346403.1 Lrp/AsnC family transcriptional regulator [Solobacterium sp.]
MDEMQLLNMLADDPRASVTDLADILGESVDAVTKAKEDLEKNKIICGYHTVINWDKTNIEHVDAFIGVSAKPEREAGYDKIAERIAKFPEVASLYLMSGTSEFMVSLNAKTMREVADFVGSKLAPIEGVTSTVTMFVLKKYKVNGITMDMKEELDDDRMIISA